MQTYSIAGLTLSSGSMFELLAGKNLMTSQAIAEEVLNTINAGGTVRQPTLAVVINCYNYEDYVGAAIESVLDQKRPDCELVVVDDGSSDGSWDVICRYPVNAVRVRNSGQPAACLSGLERTSAPFIMFLDADDALKPGSLDTIMSKLDAGVAKLQFPLTQIDSSDRVLNHAYPALDSYRDRQGLIQEVLEFGVYTSSPTSGNVFRRDVALLLREVSYDTAVDGVIIFAAPFFGDVVSITEPLAFYRLHDRNKSGLRRSLNASTLEAQINRFVGRMGHLRTIVATSGEVRSVPDPQTLYYYRERNFSHRIALGERPALRQLGGLLATLRRQRTSLRNKAALALIYVLAWASPNAGARSIMVMRYGGRKQSLYGLGRAIFSKPA